jgi:hypothetical protein
MVEGVRDRFSSFSFSLAGHEVSCFAPPCFPATMYCLTTGLKALELDNYELDLQTVSQNKPFLFRSWFISGICDSDEKLSSTLGSLK